MVNKYENKFVLTILFIIGLANFIFIQNNLHFNLDSFDNRVISIATINMIDVNSRVLLFYKCIILSLFIYFLATNFIKWISKLLNSSIRLKHIKLNKKSSMIIETLSLFGLLTLGYGLIGSSIKATILLIVCFQFLIVVLRIFRLLETFTSWKMLSKIIPNYYITIWILLSAFPVMLYIQYFFRTKSPFVFMLSFIINLIFFSFFCILLEKNKKVNFRVASKIIIKSFFPFFISPIFLPLSNEVFLILNQRNIHILSSKQIFLFFVFLTLLITFIIFFQSLKIGRNIAIRKLLKDIYYPAFLLVLVGISFKPYQSFGPPGELFESGNPGVTINQLFQYGKIPLLETFNAHAFSELIAAILFSILNGYQQWGSFLYLELISMVIYVLVFYFSIRKLISTELAVLIMILFPVHMLTQIILPEYFIVGLLSIISLYSLIRNQNFKNYFLFVLILTCSFLWRFDVGASVIPAAVVVILLYSYLYKKKLSVKNFLSSSLIISASSVLIFIILAYIKKIPMIFRIKELLSVISSNQIWGYATLGEENSIKFYIYYIILPAYTIGLIIYILHKSKISRKMKPEIFLMITFLLVFTVFNFPRGLVRHSLVENFTMIIAGFVGFPIMYTPLLFKYKYYYSYIKHIKFFSLIFIYSVLMLFTTTDIRIVDNSLIAKASEQFNVIKTYQFDNQKIPRYEESAEYSRKTYGSIKQLFDNTLSPNETFLDFSNTPYLYVFTNRITPMYINQTPAFLSDDISQKYFLEEIKKHSVPYVVFAGAQGRDNLDGINSKIRSYRISEFIYNQYTPFIEVNGFQVWVKKDKKIDFGNKLNALYEESELSNENILTTSDENMKFFDVNNIQMSKEGLALQTGSSDPQIFGIFPKTNVILNSIDSHQVVLEYSSEKGGVLQFFYTSKEGDFSKGNFVAINVSPNSVHKKIKAPVNIVGKLSEIRIDPPSSDAFTIHSMRLLDLNNVKIDYNEIDPPLIENDDVKWLAYLWGEKDKLDAVKNIKLQTSIVKDQLIEPGIEYKYTIEDIPKNEKGNYLHVRMKSSSGNESRLMIKYTGSSLMNESISGSFSFSVKSDGEYHDYLLRLSSQYNWYRASLHSLIIASAEKSDIKLIEISEGD